VVAHALLLRRDQEQVTDPVEQTRRDAEFAVQALSTAGLLAGDTDALERADARLAEVRPAYEQMRQRDTHPG